MSWTDAHTLALRHALLIVGILTILVGLYARNKRKGDLDGLSMALIVVGVMMAIADPAGRVLGWW